ncbi:MAG: site-2 protease family protein, partial [Verrucomicrobiota bacterium]
IEGTAEGEEVKKLPPVKPIDKIIVAFAGPLFSFLLAVVFAVLVWAVGKPVSESRNTTTVGIVGEDTPAEAAGILPGDKIISIDGMEIESFLGMNRSITWAVVSAEGETLSVELERPDEGRMSLEVVRPEIKEEEIEGGLFAKVWHYISARKPLPKIGVGPSISAVVVETKDHSPGRAAGLEIGDRIVSINGEDVLGYRDVSDFDWKAGEAVTLTVARDSERLEFVVTPRLPELPESPPTPAKGLELTGIAFDAAGVRGVERPNPLTQVKNGVTTMVQTLRAVISPKSDVNVSHLSGPVGIMGVYYDLFQHPDGWRLALWFSVVLNINLAILNLLPFPVLDGGHIVMATAEGIRRKALPVKFLEIIQTAFVLLLFSFIIFVTFKDIGDRVPKGEAATEVQRAFLPLQNS